MEHVAHICHCIPEYVPNIRDIVKHKMKGCNFYEHSTCVTYVYFYFDSMQESCLPACLDSTYEQARMQVSSMQAYTGIILVLYRAYTGKLIMVSRSELYLSLLEAQF